MMRAKLKYLILVLTLTGCHRNEIVLQQVTHTSEYLYCDKVFADNRDSIVQLNKILLQTGIVDTSDDSTFRAAIIHVNNQEKILDLKSSVATPSQITETYLGKGYKLILRYQPVKRYSTTTYEGEMELWNGKRYSTLKLSGLTNTL